MEGAGSYIGPGDPDNVLYELPPDNEGGNSVESMAWEGMGRPGGGTAPAPLNIPPKNDGVMKPPPKMLLCSCMCDCVA